jgi:nitroreductase
MMTLLPAIEARRARRALSAEPIAREDVETLVAAAHLAPSCNNTQPWRFVVVDEPDLLAKVRESLPGGNYWAKVAPVILAVASRRDLDCVMSDARDYFLFGCGMAVGNLMVQATSMGLIAHPIAGYKPEAVKAVLGIPGNYVLIALVIVGRPGDVNQLSDKHRAIELGPRDRKPLDTVLSRNRFSFDDPPPA